MTFSPALSFLFLFFKLFSFCSSHSVCAVTLRKEQTSRREQWKVRESRWRSYTTWSPSTPPRVFAVAALAGKNTTGGTGGRGDGGGDHDEKQSSGRMFFPRPIGKQSRCFRLSSDVLGNVFFRNLEESLLWHGNFVFVLPPMWLQQNVSDAVVHHQTLVLSHLVNINGPSLSTTSPVWRLFSIILSLLQPFRRLKNKLVANVHHLTSVGMMANVVAVVL